MKENVILTTAGAPCGVWETELTVLMSRAWRINLVRFLYALRKAN